MKLCQKWLQFRTELSPLVVTSAPCLLHLSHVLTWSCDSLSSPSLNPTLLLRTIEVFLEPSTYHTGHAHCHTDHTHTVTDHTHSVIGFLYRHLIQHHFFRSLLALFQLRVPTPDSVDATPTLLGTSLLGYLTRPLMGGVAGGSGLMYEFLANEVLGSAHSPHVTYLVLPHLRTQGVDAGPLVRGVLAGVASGDVAPTLELLYAVIQLVHSNLATADMEERLIEDYLQLVSVLLSKIPSEHVVAGAIEEEGEGEGEDVDPLSSRDAMLRHCVASLAGDELPLCLQQKR